MGPLYLSTTNKAIAAAPRIAAGDDVVLPDGEAYKVRPCLCVSLCVPLNLKHD